MVPTFANPHSLSQDVEITTRSEIAERAGPGGFTSVDENSHSLKRNLDNLLRDTWADALAETCGSPSRVKRHAKTAEICKNVDDQLAFRLVSSMKYPQRISLDPKPHSSPVPRGPDCEDDEGQAETRRIRALSVALEPKGLTEAVVLTWQINRKPVTIESKVTLANMPFARSLPPILVTEEARARETVRRVRTGNPQASESPAASPHEPRPSCVVLPVISVPDHKKMSGKKRRKPAKERPPPAYWRPSPELQGKCMGYALGYPSNWAPDRLYVRDAMKSGVKATSTCHAVHDTPHSE
ncbi:hypothetical protein J3R82DRAFT_11687 [Butyriboletus roseoflavus]|nr:hypothetical protein J3R82DRAFT_11687 [Butyriboletus roseoflavus]